MPDLVIGPLLRHVGPTHATVWVETDGPTTVEVLGHTAHTFRVGGHHYALVVVQGLEPGTTTPYQVRLDGEQVWPPPDARFPPSRIRTLGHDGATRVVFGSCRYASPHAMGERDHLGGDALDALAHRLAQSEDDDWPDLLLLLGDQVYADETTPETHRRIRARRGDSQPLGEVADFEEYTWLYAESWQDVEVRWLLSTVPSGMIFDDHDVHDDWNTSGSWRADAAAQPWWHERLVGALSSYWVYQHLGNLSPAELKGDDTWTTVQALPEGADAEPVLRRLAERADAESEGAKGYRWSFRRDLGPTRIVVVDSRCGRILDDPAERRMWSRAERDWVVAQLTGDLEDDGVRHVVVGTSLPWLMAPALHDLEAWDERLAADRRPRRARLGEKLRRAADLEHWAAFHDSFVELSTALGDLGAGRFGPPPASISVLSGDVHHSYVCQGIWDPARQSGAVVTPVHQITCSPLHNRVPAFMRIAFRVSWSRAAERSARTVLGVLARVPRPVLHWHRRGGPWFGNALSQLVFDGERAVLLVERTTGDDDSQPLRPLAVLDLTDDAATA